MWEKMLLKFRYDHLTQRPWLPFFKKWAKTICALTSATRGPHIIILTPHPFQYFWIHHRSFLCTSGQIKNLTLEGNVYWVSTEPGKARNFQIYIVNKPKICYFSKTFFFFSFSVPRCPRHDLHWFRLFDDISSAIQLQQCRNQPFTWSICYPMASPLQGLVAYGWIKISYWCCSVSLYFVHFEQYQSLTVCYPPCQAGSPSTE